MPLTFLIYSTEYDVGSGGNIALHRLAHNLCDLGHFARITCDQTAPGWSGIPTQRCVAEDGEIVIYPEVVVGNPFKARRIVRWILNTPGRLGGDGVYGSDDLLMLWSDHYSVDPKYTVSGYLRAFRPMNHFRDMRLERKGQCYAVRKGKLDGAELTMHNPEDLCIDDYALRGGDQYLLDVFNARESFLCYDNRTMLTWIAEMCGCPSMFVNHGKLEKPVFGFSDTPLTAGGNVFEREYAHTLTQASDFVRLCRERWET